MHKELNRYSAVAQAISLLLYPHAEVVIHDLKTGKIAALFNNFSKRKIGDESLLDELDDIAELPDVFPLYYKMNWDGRRLKSATATLRDQKGEPIGFLCINLDISKWEEIHQFILGWIQGVPVEKRPESLFKDDWREKINAYVTDYLKREGLILKSLNKDQKQMLIKVLKKAGAFKAKNAVNYVADVLEISRATIYNYMR